VSSEERQIVNETGKAYNMQIAFAEKRGAYLADVNLVIEGAKVNVPQGRRVRQTLTWDLGEQSEALRR
jgi:hypothetical protein